MGRTSLSVSLTADREKLALVCFVLSTLQNNEG